MKKLILISLAIFMLFACEQKSRIEIIPNYNSEYIEVSDYAKFTQNLIPEETKKQMAEEVKAIFANVSNKKENEPDLHLYQLFIDENGKMEKIEVPIYVDNLINEALISSIENWRFGKYVLYGKAKKYRINLTIMNVTYPDGKKFVNIIGNDGELIDEKVYLVSAEQMPEPIGGMYAIQAGIKYPEIAKRAGIQGRVFVKAFIDSSGIVVKAEVIKGIGAGCDESAMEAVKNVKFIPGKQRGKSVNTQVTVPILFKLQ